MSNDNTTPAATLIAISNRAEAVGFAAAILAVSGQQRRIPSNPYARGSAAARGWARGFLTAGTAWPQMREATP